MCEGKTSLQYRFMPFEDAFPLFYIYSYEKISLELRELFRKRIPRKKRDSIIFIIEVQICFTKYDN
jgi:hypothetical protein